MIQTFICLDRSFCWMAGIGLTPNPKTLLSWFSFDPHEQNSHANYLWDTDHLYNLGKVGRHSVVKDHLFLYSALWLLPGWQQPLENWRLSAQTSRAEQSRGGAMATTRLLQPVQTLLHHSAQFSVRPSKICLLSFIKIKNCLHMENIDSRPTKDEHWAVVKTRVAVPSLLLRTSRCLCCPVTNSQTHHPSTAYSLQAANLLNTFA